MVTSFSDVEAQPEVRSSKARSVLRITFIFRRTKGMSSGNGQKEIKMKRVKIANTGDEAFTIILPSGKEIVVDPEHDVSFPLNDGVSIQLGTIDDDPR